MTTRTVVVSVDSPIIQGPCVYRGGLLKASAGGAATADLYDDTKAGGQPLDSFRALTSSYDRHPPSSEGVLVMRAIYVDVGSNVDSFVLYYDDDDPSDTAGARQGP